jgi:hypothetical protein
MYGQVALDPNSISKHLHSLASNREGYMFYNGPRSHYANNWNSQQGVLGNLAKTFSALLGSASAANQLKLESLQEKAQELMNEIQNPTPQNPNPAPGEEPAAPANPRADLNRILNQIAQMQQNPHVGGRIRHPNEVGGPLAHLGTIRDMAAAFGIDGSPISIVHKAGALAMSSPNIPLKKELAEVMAKIHNATLKKRKHKAPLATLRHKPRVIVTRPGVMIRMGQSLKPKPSARYPLMRPRYVNVGMRAVQQSDLFKGSSGGIRGFFERAIFGANPAAQQKYIADGAAKLNQLGLNNPAFKKELKAFLKPLNAKGVRDALSRLVGPVKEKAAKVLKEAGPAAAPAVAPAINEMEVDDKPLDQMMREMIAERERQAAVPAREMMERIREEARIRQAEAQAPGLMEIAQVAEERQAAAPVREMMERIREEARRNEAEAQAPGLMEIVQGPPSPIANPRPNANLEAELEDYRRRRAEPGLRQGRRRRAERQGPPEAEVAAAFEQADRLHRQARPAPPLPPDLSELQIADRGLNVDKRGQSLNPYVVNPIQQKVPHMNFVRKPIIWDSDDDKSIAPLPLGDNDEGLSGMLPNQEPIVVGASNFLAPARLVLPPQPGLIAGPPENAVEDIDESQVRQKEEEKKAGPMDARSYRRKRDRDFSSSSDSDPEDPNAPVKYGYPHERHQRPAAKKGGMRHNMLRLLISKRISKTGFRHPHAGALSMNHAKVGQRLYKKAVGDGWHPSYYNSLRNCLRYYNNK